MVEPQSKSTSKPNLCHVVQKSRVLEDTDDALSPAYLATKISTTQEKVVFTDLKPSTPRIEVPALRIAFSDKERLMELDLLALCLSL